MIVYVPCTPFLISPSALIAFIFDIVLFFLAKTRINALDGASSSIGPAVWLTLAAWVCLVVSGCAFGIGRRCLSSRGPRDADGSRGSRMKMDQGYAEEARVEAIRAEEERKARQATGNRGLPGFQPYETQPLTATHRQDEYLEEDEDPGLAPASAYQPTAQPSHPNRAGSGASSFVRGGYGAGVGANTGAGYPMGDVVTGIGMGRPGGVGSEDGHNNNRAGYGAGQRSHPSDSYYATGQATPGGYPAIQEDSNCKC